ncbi:MAG: exopolysaccharide biosynthesis polyprenyl glycosylphosphotransferase [Acidobacteriales bacterium]|nr:exopolysaccharide biosynthesis polyprenyl glycosylphosphotransferase [Terriglobales bacterium]
MSASPQMAPEAASPEQIYSETVLENVFANLSHLRRTPHDHHFESLHSFTDFVISCLASSLVIVYLNTWRLGTLTKWEILLFYPVVVVVFCKQQRLYRRFPNPGLLEDGYAVIKAVVYATFVLIGCLFISQSSQLTPPVLGTVAAANVAGLIIWRIVGRQIYVKKLASGKAGTNVLIIGANKVGRALAEHLSSNRQLGYVVKGFLDETPSYSPGVLGRLEDLPRVAREEYADEIFLTIPSTSEVTKRILLDARKLCLDVTLVPELFDGLGFQAPLEYVGEFPVMELHREPIPSLGLFIKRILDLVLVTVGLFLALPLMLLLAICIYIDSPGPIFYVSKRVGKKGRVFGFYKLRSMVNNAESLKQELEAFNERDGTLFKMTNDPRVTRVGRLLRKYSLDELPQFFNVLKGDMSLVGPRPPLIGEYQKYKLEHRRRMDVLPGVTGLWQVSARKDPSFEGYVSLDLKYIENWNLWNDFAILVRTVPAVLRGTGH